jgi:acid phosphatase (class A)
MKFPLGASYRLLLAAAVLSVPSLSAQQAVSNKTPNYFDPQLLHLSLILPMPPAAGSPIAAQEQKELLHLQQTRSPELATAAQADDSEEDIFIFKDVLGPRFTALNLPILAAFSSRLKNDSEIVDPPLKHLYMRPRPYVASKAIQPICKLSTEPSYPSGHAMLGYLFAFTLVQLVPEKHDAIVKRADLYASHRLVCGVHYRSDVEASRLASAVLFGQMLANKRFESDLEAARREINQANTRN